MILGVGVDLLNINRVETVFNKFSTRFVNRILADEELELYKKTKNKINFLTKRFCVKEAFSKAIGVGIGRGLDMKDIILKNDRLGKPIVLLSDKGYDFLERYFEKDRNLIQFNVSITDESMLVNSFVVISTIGEENIKNLI